MTWPLTDEEIAFPTLLPAVPVEYPAISARVPSVVGSTSMVELDPDGSYAGPVVARMDDTPRPPFGPIQAPGMDGRMYGPGRDTSDYEAPGFYPPVARTARDAMFYTTERVQPFTVRRPNRSVDGLGQTDPVWYETPGGALGLGVAVGIASFFVTKTILRRRAAAALR
jgi:hypothetical protein